MFVDHRLKSSCFAQLKFTEPRSLLLLLLLLLLLHSGRARAREKLFHRISPHYCKGGGLEGLCPQKKKEGVIICVTLGRGSVRAN